MNSLQYLLTIFIYVALGTSLLVMAVKSPLITDLTEFESKHHLGIDWESFMNLSSDTVMVTSVDSIQRIICGKILPPTRSVDVWENFKTLKKKDREKIWKLIRIQKKEKKSNSIEFEYSVSLHFPHGIPQQLACVENHYQFRNIWNSKDYKVTSPLPYKVISPVLHTEGYVTTRGGKSAPTSAPIHRPTPPGPTHQPTPTPVKPTFGKPGSMGGPCVKGQCNEGLTCRNNLCEPTPVKPTFGKPGSMGGPCVKGQCNDMV